MEIEKLYLLIPEELPIQSELNKSNKRKLALSLDLAFQSLDASCLETAVSKVNEALSIVSEADFYHADLKISSSKKHKEALDYDDYFNINHIESQEPEICLLKSILLVYKRAVLLSQYKNNFESEMIEIQHQGFKTYFQLLRRVFDLS
ncbi:MAG: hypothetical protein AAF383_01025 [Cyanobacteria bacterium P01_A01_bin.83]